MGVALSAFEATVGGRSGSTVRVDNWHDVTSGVGMQAFAMVW